KSSGLDRDRLRSELSRHRVEQGLVQIPGDQVSPKAYEGGSLWRCLVSREATEPPKRRPVIQGFGKLDVGQVVPDRQQKRLEQADRRPSRLSLHRRTDISK